MSNQSGSPSDRSVEKVPFVGGALTTMTFSADPVPSTFLAFILNLYDAPGVRIFLLMTIVDQEIPRRLNFLRILDGVTPGLVRFR